VILKAPTALQPSLSDLARLRNEVAVLRRVAGPGIVRLIGEETREDTSIIVLADSGGRALREHPPGRALTIAEAVTFAHSAAVALDLVHRRGLVHGNIDPSHLIVTDARDIELIGFGRATDHLQQRANDGDPVGDLRFASPESTGRTGQAVDRRADLYSLGAVLYWLLSGVAPFPSSDPLEVVHGHLATRPIPPREHRPELPPPLSEIVMKLLAKSPDDRYQTAQGLAADLAHCRDGGSVPPFPLGEADAPPVLTIPPRLFGRDREIGVLEALWRYVSDGEPAICLLHGPGGVGKSSLIDLLRDRVRASNGFFLGGQADAHGADACAPLLQVLSDQVGHLLTLSSAEVGLWREAMAAALGELAAVLVEHVPRMAHLLGPHPPPPDVAAAEAANRIDRALSLALSSLAGPAHPAALCLDDLQWADHDTLRVVEAVAAAAVDRPLLLVMAWRGDEVDPGHPLRAAVDRLRTGPTRVLDLALGDLDEAAIGALLEATLHCSSGDVASLSWVVARKTGGNPFFMRQFISGLHADGHLRYDGRWRWDTDEIARADITDNVARLLGGRLAHLAPTTVQALQAAACAGVRFSVDEVAQVLGIAAQECADGLRPALDEGLVRADAGERYRFGHDRIHEAVEATMDAAQRAAAHLSLGRRLAGPARPGDDGFGSDGERVWRAARHFNEALPLLGDDAERILAARLNLQAGTRALEVGAFDSAAVCVDAGLALVGERWDDHYPLVLDLHLLGASAAALQGRIAQADVRVDRVQTQGQTALDKARALEGRLRSRMRQGRYSEALAVALTALDLLGERFPRRRSKLVDGLQLARTTTLVLGRGLEAMMALPRSEEPIHCLSMRLLSLAVPCAFLSASEEVPGLMLRLVRRSVERGRTPETPTGFAYLATIHSNWTGQTGLGERLGDLALRMADASEPGPERVRTRYLVHHMVRHWTRPLRPIIDLTPELYRESLDGGDYAFAQVVAWAWCRGSFICGVELSILARRLEQMEAAVSALGRDAAPPQWQVQRLVVECLMGAREVAQVDLSGVAEQAGDRSTLVVRWTAASAQVLLHLLFQEPSLALPHVERLDDLLEVMRGTPDLPYACYLSCLVRVTCLRAASPGRARALRKKVAQGLRQLRRWARLCPQTNAHRLSLVEGELAASAGDRDRAAREFDRAAASARANGSLMDEALALERAGLMYREAGRTRLAQVYIEDACRAWRQWGAHAKAARLESFAPSVPVDVSLDTSSAIKAARAISGEIVWQRLMQRLLHVAMENAGARQGALVLEQGGSLQIEAEGRAAGIDEVVVRRRPLHETTSLAVSVVRYAQHAREAVVLDDAASEPSFSADPYVQRARPRSIVAVPIVSGGQSEGVLYLENDLANGVFTRNRVEVLRLLAAQMAISIRNARQVAEIQAQQEQILSERELRHDEAMRSAALEARKNGLAAYLGIASHDLKSPLASIQMWARQVGGGVLDASRGQAYIEAACRRAKGLIRTYLDVAAVETGGLLALQRRPFDLARLVEDEVDFLLTRLVPEDRERVGLEWDLEPVVVDADADRLAQVVGNLAGNALEYCPLGTRIAVTLERQDGRAILRIEDDGPGVPPDMREGLFRPFERGNHELSSTGLGLWISRVIVEAHGGRIGLEERTAGTCFVVELPLEGT
jgi:predicted ATPase/signal transduction histidine kinase